MSFFDSTFVARKKIEVLALKRRPLPKRILFPQIIGVFSYLHFLKEKLLQDDDFLGKNALFKGKLSCRKETSRRKASSTLIGAQCPVVSYTIYEETYCTFG